jgi:hypothetical protein
MPTIRVELFAGRTLDQKRALAQALTEATVRTLGGSADDDSYSEVICGQPVLHGVVVVDAVQIDYCHRWVRAVWDFSRSAQAGNGRYVCCNPLTNLRDVGH